MTTEADVVIVGGGVMGSSAAWHLSRRGKSVLLIERYSAGHHRGASHGESRVFRENFDCDLYLEMARESRAQWRELERASGRSILSLTGGIEHGSIDRLKSQAEGFAQAGAEFSWCGRQEAESQWPGLRFDGPALHFPNNGRIASDEAWGSFRDLAVANGCVVQDNTAVHRVTVRGDTSVEVVTSGQTIRARSVVVTVGAWVNKFLAGQVALPPMVVTQEQPAYFGATSVDDDSAWPVFNHRFGRNPADPAMAYGGVYGAYTPGQGIKVGFHGVGPLVDPDTRDFLPDVRVSSSLREYVRQWIPGADADAAEEISCLYTTTPDSDFVIDKVGPLVVGAGFSGQGFKFAPVIGSMLADLATGVGEARPKFLLDRPRS